MNVKTAFLNENSEENVYMDQAVGIIEEGKEHMVCKLKKSIYGLKQDSRQWYLKFNDIIMCFEYKENIVDQCIYMKVNGSKFIILILYVDDILLATNDLGLLSETKKFLSKMKYMGETYYVIGIEIFCDRSQGLLGLSRKEYMNISQGTKNHMLKYRKSDHLDAPTMEAKFVACFKAIVQGNWCRIFIS